MIFDPTCSLEKSPVLRSLQSAKPRLLIDQRLDNILHILSINVHSFCSKTNAYLLREHRSARNY